MIEVYDAVPKPTDEEIKVRTDAVRKRLFEQQLLIKEKKLPVLVLFEGFGAAGKGTVLGGVIEDLDPRFFRSLSMHEPTDEEQRKPFLYRYFNLIPEQGQFLFLDSGWMSELTHDMMSGKISEKKYRERIASIKRFERGLTDNGYLVVKYFMHISKKEQKSRLNKLLESKDTAWQVGAYDKWENKNYDECYKVFDEFMEDTSTSTAPWYIVSASNKKWARLQVMETLAECIDTALKSHSLTVPLTQNIFPLKKAKKLSAYKLDQKMTKEKYQKEEKELQKKLKALHNKAYLKGIPIIVAYEGWDAAGKGGNIKRLTEALDPRGYEVHPIASPKPYEKSRHFLWRFWTRLPKTGHFAIFDRTWYGRVMVERLEGFCSEGDWMRAYNEINEFEKELVDWGAIVIKFFVQIDKDTQLERFTLRQNTPEKQWKITDEDWRNREKWDDYEIAINEMISKTNTEYAPWVILESNNKYYARIKALKTVIKRIEERLK